MAHRGPRIQSLPWTMVHQAARERAIRSSLSTPLTVLLTGPPASLGTRLSLADALSPPFAVSAVADIYPWVLREARRRALDVVGKGDATSRPTSACPWITETGAATAAGESCPHTGDEEDSCITKADFRFAAYALARDFGGSRVGLMDHFVEDHLMTAPRYMRDVLVPDLCYAEAVALVESFERKLLAAGWGKGSCVGRRFVAVGVEASMSETKGSVWIKSLGALEDLWNCGERLQSKRHERLTIPLVVLPEWLSSQLRCL